MQSSLGGSEPRLEGRLRLAGGFVLLVFAIFGLRLFQLQVVEGDELRRRSEENSIRTLRLQAPRGEILDREGRVLATTRPAWELQVVPSALDQPERTWAVLGELVAEEPTVLSARLDGAGGVRHRPVSIVDDLDFDSLSRVETHRHALPGVVTDVQPRRHYLEGSLAAHLLGTIGEVRPAQLAQERFGDYAPGDVVGQTGLESLLESHLRGSDGGRNVVVDVAGRVVEVLDEVQPVPGGRAVLTLDLDLQRAAEAAFEPAEGQDPPMGALVALDVHSGDVLALVSRPAYDPNRFVGGIDAESWKALTEDEWKPLQNRAIQTHYPPGSTHKAIVGLALLEAGTVTPETTAYCPGFFRHGRRTYRCWKRSGHGTVDLHDALKESCDVYFYTYGVQLGIDRIAEFARSFGLGRPTGMALPGEAPGLVPTSDWKARRFGEPWYPGETVSASIGQGYNLYTTAQLAVSYAALGNGGKVMKPRLLIRLESHDGELLEQRSPELLSRIQGSPENLQRVLSGLTAVVEEQGGTGGRARVPGLRVAGKTGTAQVVRLTTVEGLEDEEIPIRFRDHAWFGALAPAEAPRIVVAAFVEHGLHGSSAAAPIARAVLAVWHEKQGGGTGQVAGAKP
ncbi:MAG: penicillin-binding protein 2 [Myxococcota bacterium]|nr:penicillin-binding protein 2 [Myxococcota bacterium]